MGQYWPDFARCSCPVAGVTSLFDRLCSSESHSWRACHDNCHEIRHDKRVAQPPPGSQRPPRPAAGRTGTLDFRTSGARRQAYGRKPGTAGCRITKQPTAEGDNPIGLSLANPSYVTESPFHEKPVDNLAAPSTEEEPQPKSGPNIPQRSGTGTHFSIPSGKVQALSRLPRSNNYRTPKCSDRP